MKVSSSEKRVGPSDLRVGSHDPSSLSSSNQPTTTITSPVQPCPDCEEQFASKTTLNLHRLKVHVVSPAKFPCPQCNKEVEDLSEHLRSEHQANII